MITTTALSLGTSEDVGFHCLDFVLISKRLLHCRRMRGEKKILFLPHCLTGIGRAPSFTVAFVLLDTQMETCSLKTQAQVKAMHTASTYSLHSCKDYTATFNVEKKG